MSAFQPQPRRAAPLLSLLSSSPSDDDLPYQRGKRRRRLVQRPRLVFGCACAVLLLVYWVSTRHRPISRASDWVPWPSLLSTASSYPLTFAHIREYERRLPQHDTSLPPPEGKNGRYLMFSNEVWGLGLNNQMDNRLVLSHLAYLSNRSYVFHDIMFNETWDNGVWFPLNTFISGPTAGGSFPPSVSAPRAVSTDYWDKVCRGSRTVPLDVHTVNEELGYPDKTELLDRWAEKLGAMPNNCIEIIYTSEHILDHHFFGSQRSLSLFPALSTSPVITNFRWSDIVLHAVARNTPLIMHSHSADATRVTHFSPPGTTDATRLTTGMPAGVISSLMNDESLSGVLALHIRRGDYGTHCHSMAEYASGYNSWNLLPSLPDVYHPQDGPLVGQDLDNFMRHCWPSIEDIVQRVRQVKSDYEEQGRGRLKSIYILTNGKRDWISELGEKLLTSGMGWERVTSSRDLVFVGQAEKLANQAVDMEIARRAAAFIGNGFSTMTANVLLFRLVHGMPAETTRFW